MRGAVGGLARVSTQDTSALHIYRVPVVLPAEKFARTLSMVIVTCDAPSRAWNAPETQHFAVARLFAAAAAVSPLSGRLFQFLAHCAAAFDSIGATSCDGSVQFVESS